MPEAWYYANGRNRVGPLSKDDLIQALSIMPDPGNTFVWRTGLSDWQKASELPEVFPYVAKPPPLPPPRLNDSVVTPQLQPSTEHPVAGISIWSALFSFRGRLNRTQYALILLLGYLGPLAILTVLTDTKGRDDYAYIAVVLVLIAIWTLFASVAKRFHDIDKPTLYLFVFIVPVIGFIWALALLFIPGNVRDE
jgi:uncharacterized membrane protein YhaH (DUF805 family)